MKVVWLRRAAKSLDQIADYIAQDNPDAAYALILKVQKSVEMLRGAPQLGREGRVNGTREYIIPGTNDIIPYRVKKDQLQILHVFHGFRRWPNQF